MKKYRYVHNIGAEESLRCRDYLSRCPKNRDTPIIFHDNSGRRFIIAHGNMTGHFIINEMSYKAHEFMDLYGSMFVGKEMNIICCYGFYYPETMDPINDMTFRTIFKTRHMLNYRFQKNGDLEILTEDFMENIPEGFEYTGTVDFDEKTLRISELAEVS